MKWLLTPFHPHEHAGNNMGGRGGWEGGDGKGARPCPKATLLWVRVGHFLIFFPPLNMQGTTFGSGMGSALKMFT